MKLNRKFFKWSLVLGGMALAAVVWAEVYIVRGGGAQGAELNNGLYRWENAYQTTMTINGRKSKVRLYAVDRVEPVLGQLKSRFEQMGAEVFINAGSEGATGWARWPDHEAKFLVLSPPSMKKHLIFVFYPEPGIPQPVSLPVPTYTGAEVAQTVSDDDTGVFLATLTTSDSSVSVHDFYCRELQAQGWKQLVPPSVAQGAVSGMAVYVQANRVCYVQATEHAGQANTITLLVNNGTL